MSGDEIRTKYLEFFKRQNHVIVPSSGLVPDNDPTTLFTGSGMQPMLPYLLGEIHPKGTRITDSQKSFRAEDIEEVGDNRHTTFFEMLGNWSFGDYFKKEQIAWMFEFLTKEVGIDPNRLYISAFGGDAENNLPKDTEAPFLWQELFKTVGIDALIADIGSEADGYARGIKAGERIFYYEAKKNWWSRAGIPEKMPIGEPGGPDSEMFYDFGTPHDSRYGEHCHPNCDCGRFMEIGNNVFMQYVKTGEHEFQELKNKNIDFGGGLERIAAAQNNNPDVFKIDLLWNVVDQIQTLSGKKYEDNLVAFRVVTDHIRGAVFMIGDGIHPGNTEQPYFVRRLLRRAVRYADILGIPAGELKNLAESVIRTYKGHYTNLADKKTEIIDAIGKEEEQFRKTLERGLRIIKNYLAIGVSTGGSFDPLDPKDVADIYDSKNRITGIELFKLYSTHGFPVEVSLEEIDTLKKNQPENKFLDYERDVVIKEFNEELVKHQELSRAGAEQKFKGGLADHSEKVVQYHTATHLLLAGLRHELGDHVHQAGSNITGERLRFDFTHGEKVSDEILRKVEVFVNDVIAKGAHVTTEIRSKEDARKDPTIEASFWERYPDEVKVYTVQGTDGEVFSRELCGGPHIENTDGMGTFKIQKEEAVASGIRRIKAVLE